MAPPQSTAHAILTTFSDVAVAPEISTTLCYDRAKCLCDGDAARVTRREGSDHPPSDAAAGCADPLIGSAYANVGDLIDVGVHRLRMLLQDSAGGHQHSGLARIPKPR
jgi:hypothetical protein